MSTRKQPKPVNRKLREPGIKFELWGSATGISFLLNGYRLCGPKPAPGGKLWWCGYTTKATLKRALSTPRN